MRTDLALGLIAVSKEIEGYVETLQGEESSPRPEETTAVLVTVAKSLLGIANDAVVRLGGQPDSHDSTHTSALPDDAI